MICASPSFLEQLHACLKSSIAASCCRLRGIRPVDLGNHQQDLKTGEPLMVVTGTATDGRFQALGNTISTAPRPPFTADDGNHSGSPCSISVTNCCALTLCGRWTTVKSPRWRPFIKNCGAETARPYADAEATGGDLRRAEMDCRASLSMNIWFFIQPSMTKPLPSWRAKRGHP